MQNENLKNLFNLPDDEAVFADLKEPLPAEIVNEITEDALTTLDKINAALPQVRRLEADDREMDELARLATESYKDLVDLGMQVDSRSAGDILGQASNFLGHAITAKTAKMNKKLKMIDLQLKKAKLDADRLKNHPEEETTITGTVMDRNELLTEILNRQKEQDS